MDRSTCSQIGGKWQNNQCVSKFGVLTESIGKKVEERKKTFSEAKSMSSRFKAIGEKATSSWTRKKILPRWLITFVSLLVFTLVFYAPVFGLIAGVVAAVITMTVLNVWSAREEEGDKEINIAIYGLFVLIWLGTGLLSFLNISWISIIFAGLAVDILNALSSALDRVVKISFLNYIMAAINFAVLFALLPSFEGSVVAAIAGLLALIVPLPSFIPFPPYILPITTILLLIIKLIASYIGEIFGAII